MPSVGMTPCMVPTQDCGLDLWIWWVSLLSLTIWQRRNDLNKALISWFWVKQKGYYFGWTWPNWVTPLKYSPGIPWSQKFWKTETLSLVGFEEASFHEFCNLQEILSTRQESLKVDPSSVKPPDENTVGQHLDFSLVKNPEKRTQLHCVKLLPTETIT